MRSYHVPDAVVPPPRFGRITSQIRSCLLPDSLKSIGPELRRIVRSTSTDVARERRQRILLKPTIKKILLGAGFKVAMRPSSFGCRVALSLKKALSTFHLETHWRNAGKMLPNELANSTSATERNKKIPAKDIPRGDFCLFDCSIIQRGAWNAWSQQRSIPCRQTSSSQLQTSWHPGCIPGWASKTPWRTCSYVH